MIFSYFGVLNFDISQFIITNLKTSLSEIDLENRFKRKIYSSLVEGLENIFRHGSETQNSSNGIVMLTRQSDTFCLTLGNSVTRAKELKLIDGIDEMKDESLESLKLLYKKKLGEADEAIALSANLGLIQIAINCENSYEFHFLPLNNSMEKLFLFDIFLK